MINSWFRTPKWPTYLLLRFCGSIFNASSYKDENTCAVLFKCCSPTVMHSVEMRKVNRFSPVGSALKLNCAAKDERARYPWMRRDLMMSAALWWSTDFRVVAFMSVRTCEYIWHCGGATLLSWTGSVWHQRKSGKVMAWNSFYSLYITLLTLFFHFSSSNIITSAGLIFAL